MTCWFVDTGGMEPAMRRYTFLVGSRNTICEMSGVRLPDDETACRYAVAFAAEVFRSHHELCAGDWQSCSVQVLTSAHEEILLTTVAEAAVMERDEMRLRDETAADN